MKRSNSLAAEPMPFFQERLGAQHADGPRPQRENPGGHGASVGHSPPIAYQVRNGIGPAKS
jgi:hypothetical protein